MILSTGNTLFAPMSKEKRLPGGRRRGAGRKPLADPKVPVTVYAAKSEVFQVGGLFEAKGIALGAIQAAAVAKITKKST